MKDALRLFGLGYSWGGFESLTKRVNPRRNQNSLPFNCSDNVVRLHLGLEHRSDLTEDIEQLGANLKLINTVLIPVLLSLLALLLSYLRAQRRKSVRA